MDDMTNQEYLDAALRALEEPPSLAQYLDQVCAFLRRYIMTRRQAAPRGEVRCLRPQGHRRRGRAAVDRRRPFDPDPAPTTEA